MSSQHHNADHQIGDLRELRARRAALLLPYSAALEVEKRCHRESLPPEVVDLLDSVTRGFVDASLSLREARRVPTPRAETFPPSPSA